jgi:hypothetical protein
MSTLAIVLIIVAVVMVAVFAGGLVVASRRSRSPDYGRHVAAADQALEQARAADRGWDRPTLEAAARDALAQHRPDFGYDRLHLILVDDRPGIEEDRAHFAAVGADGEARVVLVRSPDGWLAEEVL